MSMMPKDRRYAKPIFQMRSLGLRLKSTFCMRWCAISWQNVAREQRIPRTARQYEAEGQSLGVRKERGGLAQDRDVRLYGAVAERSLVRCPALMPTLCPKKSGG